MAKGSTASEGSGGENIQHFSTIRIRAVGDASLLITVNSLDKSAKSKTLAPVTVTPTARIEPNRIVNFVEQRASFTLATKGRDEHVRINRIIVYMKQIYTSHPGA